MEKVKLPHGRGDHCKPVHRDCHSHLGIESNSSLLLWKNATELVISRGKSISGYAISELETNITTRLSWSHNVESTITALTSINNAIIAILQVRNETSIVRIVPDAKPSCRVIACLPGQFIAVAPRLQEILLCIQPSGSSATSKLIRVDGITGNCLFERTLPSSVVDLQTDSAGTWLTITYRSLETVVTIPATLEVWPPEATSRAVVTEIAKAAPIAVSTCKRACSCSSTKSSCEEKSHHCKCSSCCGQGGMGSGGGGTTTGGGTTSGGGNGTTGGGGTTSGGGNGTTGDGGSSSGGSGVPLPGGGTAVGGGGGIANNGGDWGTVGCRINLHWNPWGLSLAGAFIIAQDQKLQNVAIISQTPFAMAQEYQSRKGFRLAIDRTSPKMFLFNLASHQPASSQKSSVTAKQLAVSGIEFLNLAAPGLRDDIEKLNPVFPLHLLDIGTFSGPIVPYSLMAGHAPTFGPIQGLLIPIIEKSQTFSSTTNDMTGWGAFMQRTMVPKVQDYYLENSFGGLRDVSFKIFGSDLAPGGPAQLPMNLSDYYFPAYDPAKLTLTRNVPAGNELTFDGRDTLAVVVQPDGGLQPTTLEIPFPALIFEWASDSYPAVIIFDSGDTLDLDFEDGTSQTSTFPAQTFSFQDDGTQAQVISDLTSFFDTNLPTNVGTKIFATPVIEIIPVAGENFGTLVITINAQDTSGPRLGVTSATFTGTDLGNFAPLTGTMDPSSPSVKGYIDAVLSIANWSQKFDNSTTRTGATSVNYDIPSGTLTTTLTVGDSVGGPKATINLDPSAKLDELYTSSSTVANNGTTLNNTEAVNDWYDILSSALGEVVSRIGSNAQAILAAFPVILLMPVEAAPMVAGDVDSANAGEVWTVSAMQKPIDFRGWEIMQTISNGGVSLQAVWALVLNLNSGTLTAPVLKPDSAMIFHEMGHGIGFRDLYGQTGYREDLVYLGDWAMMCNHERMPHHCGYHKWQAGWIPDTVINNTPARVVTVPATSDPGTTSGLEALLVPVEIWNDSLLTDAPAAFGTDDTIPVVQLVKLDLGGDEVVFDLIEARQPGVHFSQNLPGRGIVCTNAYVPWDDQRYSFNQKYRRECQLLNSNNIISNPGDIFDFADAEGYPFPGITVTILDKKIVDGADVYHIKVDRVNKSFIDLYFTQGDPTYRSPDLYVDWVGDNPDKTPAGFRHYPDGQPLDQGEDVHTPQTGTELHWLVARIRNRGGVQAEQVNLNYLICDPGGAGDGGSFVPLGSTTIDTVPGGDVDAYGIFGWEVGPTHSNHVCIAVEVADFQIPVGSDGAALATGDTWFANNHCQKNVTSFVPLSASPYDPVAFQYSVNNNGVNPEIAYLEPENLPYGFTLTVIPRSQTIPPKTTAIFNCTLQLDDTILAAGCKNDQQFRLNAWRKDPESSTKWGGVQYKVFPRRKVAISLTANWGYNPPNLTGTVSPNPGGGQLRLWIAFNGTGNAPFWVFQDLDPQGNFSWSVDSPPGGGATQYTVYAAFDGNLTFGPMESDVVVATKQILY